MQGWVQLETHTFRFCLWQGSTGKVLFCGWAADPIVGYPGGFAIGGCEWRVEGERAIP